MPVPHSARHPQLSAAVLATIAMSTCATLSCTRRPSASKWETQAIAALYRFAFAQAAYSCCLPQNDGIPRFAEDYGALCYADYEGKPIALVPQSIAEATSPETARMSYYFCNIPRDAERAIEPGSDFAICAVPVREDYPRFVIRGTVGVVYMERSDDRLNARQCQPVSVYPKIGEDPAWIPIGFAGHVRVKKAGVVEAVEWPLGRWGEALTCEDFRQWLQNRETACEPR